jgi:hypothetical protein
MFQSVKGGFATTTNVVSLPTNRVPIRFSQMRFLLSENPSS